MSNLCSIFVTDKEANASLITTKKTDNMNKITLINRFATITEQLQRLLDRRVAGLSASPIQIEALQKELNSIINQLNA